jgi:hypothetical protein
MIVSTPPPACPRILVASSVWEKARDEIKMIAQIKIREAFRNPVIASSYQTEIAQLG